MYNINEYVFYSIFVVQIQLSRPTAYNTSRRGFHYRGNQIRNIPDIINYIHICKLCIYLICYNRIVFFYSIVYVLFVLLYH